MNLAVRFSTFANRPIAGWPFWVLAISMTAWYILMVANLGVREQGDASDFQMMADSYIRHGGDLRSFFAANKDLPLSEQLGITEVFYLAIVALIANLKGLMGETWRTGFIAVNILAMSAASMLLLVLARWSKLSIMAAAIGVMLLALNWELFNWAAYVGTDVLFLPFAALVFLMLARAFCAGRGIVRSGLFFLGLLVVIASLTIRPAGLWLFTFFILAICIRPWVDVAIIGERRRNGARLLLVGLLLAAIGIFAASTLMDDPSLLGVASVVEVVSYFADYNANGEVIRGRPETFVPPPMGPFDYAKLILLKYVYYFAFAGEDFSAGHYLYNYIFYSLYFALVVAGIVALFHRPGQISRAAHTLGMLAILFLSVFASAHALTIIDFDWRYRMPCYGPLTLLAMIAVDVYFRPLLTGTRILG